MKLNNRKVNFIRSDEHTFAKLLCGDKASAGSCFILAPVY